MGFHFLMIMKLLSKDNGVPVQARPYHMTVQVTGSLVEVTIDALKFVCGTF